MKIFVEKERKRRLQSNWTGTAFVIEDFELFGNYFACYAIGMKRTEE